MLARLQAPCFDLFEERVLKNKVREHRFLAEDWDSLKKARNQCKNGKLPRYLFHTYVLAAKKKSLRARSAV